MAGVCPAPGGPVKTNSLLPALLLAAALPAFGAAPPPETSARLREAFAVLGDEGPVASYTLTTRSTVAKPDGDDREDSVLIHEISRLADGSRRVKVRQATTNGKDETAERQKQIDEARAERATSKADKKKNKEEHSVSLGLPFGEDAGKYEFSAPTAEGDLLVASFAPSPAHAKDDGVTRGRVAWRGDTLDPAWLEAQPVELPTGVSAMTMRFEFARAGALVYPRLTVTDGQGGLLWIKRRFHIEVEITDLAPESAAEAAR